MRKNENTSYDSPIHTVIAVLFTASGFICKFNFVNCHTISRALLEVKSVITQN
ncbi:hypothetical protein [Flavobacterium sp.]|uniref:hypothetical protein n=1 Tax=Flavobacterium sp. TaxID=239 RepID=UPI0032636BD2